MPDFLDRAFIRAPIVTLTNSNTDRPWAGSTVLGSGQATVTVSTTNVKSDSLFTSLVGQSTTVTSGFGLEVRTVIDSTSFVIARSNNGALPVDLKVFWMFMNTKF